MGGRITGYLARSWRAAVWAVCLAGVLSIQSAGTLLAADAAQPPAEEEIPEIAALGQGASASLRERLDKTAADILFAMDIIEPLFDEVLEGWLAQGYRPVPGVDIKIPAWEYSAAGGGTFEVQTGVGGREGQALMWTEEESWLEYEVDIPQSGLYNIEIEYYPLPGKRASIQRDIKIDGEYQFNEARRILFMRFWKDSHYPPDQDNQGNDVRPRQVEVPQWGVARFEDPQAIYTEPLLFYFSEGRHTIRLTAIREPIAITYVRIVSPNTLPTYAEVLQEYREKGYREAQNVVVKVQAEWPVIKSDPTIRAEFGFDPEEEPKSDGNWRLNEFGSWRWRLGHQYATWKFSVPEDGLYKIGFKVWQGWGERMPSVREVAIDGKVPFRELKTFQFPYNKYWRITTLADPEGNPYLFYLTEGEHTITMKVRVGPIARTIRFLQTRIQQLAIIAREITMITGPNPDPNMDWEVYNKIPNLLTDLEEMAEAFEQEAEFVRQYAGARPRLTDQLLMNASQFRNMIRYPESIQNRLGELATIEQQLGFWVLQLQYMPLAMDYFLVASPDTVFPNVRASAVARFTESVKSFLASFHKNYTGIGSIYDAAESGDVINLWVGRGREWALIMKEMIEEDFTPTTGIRVNVNVIPANQLNDTSQMSVIILASSSGKAPDVATGVPATLPVEFAIRGGVVDVSQFPNYNDVISRFRPGALIPFQWQGGLYAIPETQGFAMQFYRIDILGQFGLQPPTTWDDVIGMLPTLQQYGTNFYYPAAPGNFTPILYQFGGEYYTEDGLRSALDSPEAYEAFKLWTSLYAQYRVPIEANFYTRMRTGEMPIGVADYYNYVLLSTAAPELTGWWRMDPIPGIRKPDGTVDRTTGGYADTGVIFSTSSKQEAAFKLLDWWTSTPIQSRYAQELEALIGVEARWNTANVEALFGLPWPKRDIEAIAEQWRWFKEQPIVLGGYFTTRHLQNAWNRVVLEGHNPREALEDAVKLIDRELQRKQEEFGVFIERDRPVAVIQTPSQ
ncbi:MAG TPA: extracellular solute-binding protein [Limnochordia bacterium]